MEEGQLNLRFLSPLRRELCQDLLSPCCAGRWCPPGPAHRRAIAVGGGRVTAVNPRGMSGVGIEACSWGLLGRVWSGLLRWRLWVRTYFST